MFRSSVSAKTQYEFLAKHITSSLVVLLGISMLGLSLDVNAQQVIGGTATLQQFSHSGDGGGEINLGNLDIHIEIPLRGMSPYGPDASAKLVLDTGTFLAQNRSPSTLLPYNVFSAPSGPSLQTSVSDFVFISNIVGAPHCGGLDYGLQGVLDRNGTYHDTPPITMSNTCDTMVVSPPGNDGWAIGAYQPSGLPNHPIQLYAISPDGTYTQTTGVTGILISNGTNSVLVFPRAAATPATTTDIHGNQVSNSLSITYNTNNGNKILASGSLTDAAGNTVLSASLNSPTTVKLTYPGPTSTSTFLLSYTWLTIDGNYGCVNPPTPFVGRGLVPVITQITTPDNATMAFTYESSQTPGNYTGRITSMRLTTGATITFNYQGGTNGINCSDGSTAGIAKVTPDGTWIYSHTPPSGCDGIHACLSTTTVTAPSNDYTVYTFDQTTTEAYPAASNVNLPIQQVACAAGVSQASCLSGSNLGSTVICYNGNAIAGADPSNCTNATYIPPLQFPIAERSIYTFVPGVPNPALVDYLYNQGLLTQTSHYDFGGTLQGANLKYVESTGYQSGVTSNVNGVSVPVVAAVSSTEQQAVGTQLFQSASTLYIYDAAGNVAKKQTQYGVNLASTAITTYQHDSKGRLTSSVGPNGETEDLTYLQCSGTLPDSDSVTVPTGQLTSHVTWNCASETASTYTDQNGTQNGTQWSFGYNNDPYWRIGTSTDPTGAVTTYTYTTTTEDVRQQITASSVTEMLTTVDSMGRPHLAQERQGPTSTMYNTVETDYDANGRVSRITVPYAATAGATNTSAPAYTISYDGVSRVIQTVSPPIGASGTTKSISYNGNDALVTISPAPAGEHPKAKQYENNGLGWLTSVCEVTASSVSGSHPCGQHAPANGFLTTYTYGPTGLVTGIMQNTLGSPTQTRSFGYENNNTGRVLTRTTPESGTVSTIYDNDPSGTCSAGFIGFPVSTIDNAGAITCLTYDIADRLTGQTFPQGLNNAATPPRTYGYDVGLNTFCASGCNQGGALAYAITGSVNNPLTQLQWTYDAVGRPITHSLFVGGTASIVGTTGEAYFANGAVSYLDAVPLDSVSYSLDPMGRPAAASFTGTGASIVTSVQYNVADLPTQVTVGSGDSTNYSWANGLGPMTGASYKVGTSTIGHTLGWNPNGSLKTLTISDPLDANDNQTCSFAYDDLERISTDNCGGAWSESFSYDPFGNVTKSGSAPWPIVGGYNQNTNRYSSSAFTYDANGRLTNDTFDTLGWDVKGNLITQSGTSIIYDALDRPLMAGPTVYLYAPDGSLLGTELATNAANLQFIPFPMGEAVTTENLVQHYDRQDWQGSIRVASTSTQTLYADTAYDAFGIPYASQGSIDAQYAGLTSEISSGGEQASLTRRYHPTQGRWISPDSVIPDLTSPQTFNAYHYALNIPTSVTDPGGEQEVPTPGNPGEFQIVTGTCRNGSGIVSCNDQDGGIDSAYYGVPDMSSDADSVGGPINALNAASVMEQFDNRAVASVSAATQSNSALMAWIAGSGGIGFGTVNAPSFGWSMVPVVGSAWSSIHDFQTGHWGWGIANPGLAVSDVFLVKSLATAGVKITAVGLSRVAAKSAIGATGEVGEAALKELVGGESQAFFQTSRGARFVDQLANGVAHESKVGYTTLTASIRKQIAKDIELQATGRIQGASWHFFQSPITGLVGPSAPLREALENAGISVLLH